MKVKYSRWRTFCIIGICLAVPAAFNLFVEPDLGSWTDILHYTSYAVVFGLGGLGALVGFLKMAGVIVFIYTEREKQSFSYKVEHFMESSSMKNEVRSAGAQTEDSKGNRPPEK
jgi:hypothetical protein